MPVVVTSYWKRCTLKWGDEKVSDENFTANYSLTPSKGLR